MISISLPMSPISDLFYLLLSRTLKSLRDLHQVELFRKQLKALRKENNLVEVKHRNWYSFLGLDLTLDERKILPQKN
jgi:hypothetical protein